MEKKIYKVRVDLELKSDQRKLENDRIVWEFTHFGRKSTAVMSLVHYYCETLAEAFESFNEDEIDSVYIDFRRDRNHEIVI